MAHTPLLLAILDGLALNPKEEANAFKLANTPVIDKLLLDYPNTTLTTFGASVGLPDGQMGNSEVGHLNIGAGRIVEQDLTRINRTSENNSFKDLRPMIEIAKILRTNYKALHLVGLTSPGGVHSQLSQLESILLSSCELQIPHVFIHVITDGRDRPRDSACSDLVSFEQKIAELNSKFPKTKIKITSLIGRYYAMDRDNRWERTKKAYDLFVHGIGEKASSLSEALTESYKKEVYDEFINPVVFDSSLERSKNIEDGDCILFYNFRADRMRQMVSTFIDNNFSSFDRGKFPNLPKVVTMCEYDEQYEVDCLFPPIKIEKHFGEVISQQGLSQLRIAETEKYPHVTYFFSGGSEVVLEKEERILVPSPRDVATYDLKPEMSANGITEKLISRLKEGSLDVIILNFANCDMVGHTGSLEAAIKAVETVDSCLGKILSEILALNGSALITADHGNSDQMIDYQTREPHTYHTLHPVPFIFVSADASNYNLEDGGALCDIAPTALDILELSIPAEMTGKSLIKKR